MQSGESGNLNLLMSICREGNNLYLLGLEQAVAGAVPH